MKEKSISLLTIHIAVFLFGFTAVLGSLIELPTFLLVWWRVAITSISLLFFINTHAIKTMFTSGLSKQIIGVGCIVALHWLCFYGSVKWSNASLALICMSTTSAFTSILEPLFLRQAFRKNDMLVSLLLIPCFIIIAREIPNHFVTGMVLGLGAAFLAAVFSVLNKKYIPGQHLMTFTFLQISGATVFLSFILGMNEIFPVSNVEVYVPSGLEQWIYMLTLSLVCTTLAYALSLHALKQISAFTSNLVINLEPVYGILLAFLILGDQELMSPTFYVGALVVFLIVIVYPLYTKKFD